MLQQVYSGFGRQLDTRTWEQEYQQLRHSRWKPAMRELVTNPETRSSLLALTTEKNWRESWLRYDNLRFARLCAHLRTREPDAMIGYSILVYRVNEAELATALGVKPSGRLAAPRSTLPPENRSPPAAGHSPAGPRPGATGLLGPPVRTLPARSGVATTNFTAAVPGCATAAAPVRCPNPGLVARSRSPTSCATMRDYDKARAPATRPGCNARHAATL